MVLLANAPNYDDDDITDFIWEAATGDVHHYNVYASVNDGAYALVATTPTESVALVLNLVPGDKVVVMVEAADDKGATGDMSEASEDVWRVVDIEEPDAAIGK